MILNLSLEEINSILLALGELPAKQSMGLILKIQTQAQPQMDDKDGKKESE